MLTARVAAATVTVQPVIWNALGYQFEAASMLAGLASCLIVRLWIALRVARPTLWAWSIDLAVTGIALLFTASSIALQRPAPFYALLFGTGFGALGRGIIAVAAAWVKRLWPFADNVQRPRRPDPARGDADGQNSSAKTNLASNKRGRC